VGSRGDPCEGSGGSAGGLYAANSLPNGRGAGQMAYMRSGAQPASATMSTMPAGIRWVTSISLLKNTCSRGVSGIEQNASEPPRRHEAAVNGHQAPRVLDAKHHAPQAGQGRIQAKSVVRKDGCRRRDGKCRRREQHGHKCRRLRLWAGVRSGEHRSGALGSRERDIGAGDGVFHAGKPPRGWLARWPPCGSAARLIMRGLQRNMTIGPETENHAERRPEWHEAAQQEEHCQKRPEPRHA
jgi:hypothetical protein